MGLYSIYRPLIATMFTLPSQNISETGSMCQIKLRGHISRLAMSRQVVFDFSGPGDYIENPNQHSEKRIDCPWSPRGLCIVPTASPGHAGRPNPDHTNCR